MHDQVNYLGVLDQSALATAYAQALCVIVPNIEMENGEFEGFGLVAVEAAAAGGVVLASATGGIRSAVKDGVTGFLVEPENAENWSAKILEISNWSHAKRNAFIDLSVKETREHFSWDRVARETEAVYEL